MHAQPILLRAVLWGAGLTGLAVLSLVLGSCSKSHDTPTGPPPPTPMCSLDHTRLDFGSVVAGSTKDLTFAISNVGDGVLAGTVRSGSADFLVHGDSTYSLASSAKKTFTIRFAPSAAVAYACTLATGATECASVICTGTGATPAPLCQVSPSSLDFGDVEPFCSKTLNLFVSNTGTGTLTGKVSFSCQDFAVVGDSTYSLSAGQTKSIPVRFSPRTFGLSTCLIDASSSGCTSVAASGNGVVAFDLQGVCNCSPQISTLDFGDVCIGQTVTRKAYILVNGSAGGNTYGVAASMDCPDTRDPTAWSAGATPSSLPGGGGVATVTVSFTPTHVGSSGALVLLFCSGNSATLYPHGYVYCTARGAQPPNCPTCSVSPNLLNFGLVPVGTTKDLTLQVTNTGGGILSGTAGPSHCSVFTFLAPTDYSLGPGQSTTVTVRYTPAQLGVTTSCDAVPAGPGCSDLTLEGEASGPPSCALSTTLLDFGSVAVGQSKDLTFDLENSGGGTLCGSMASSCADFVVVQNGSYCITPPGFVRVTVRFTPSGTGSQQCTVAPGSNCVPVTVLGTGT